MSGDARSQGGDEALLEEILGALQLPDDGLRKWFAHERAFCDAHGGRRVYGELLSIFDECESALARRPARP